MSIFKFKVQLFIDEILVVLLAPYTLCVSLPNASQHMLNFLREHTTPVEGIGSVCACSRFNLGAYDGPTASPDAPPGISETLLAKFRMKMQNSLLNFKVNYPEWKCYEKGRAFIDGLCNFQEQRVPELVARRQQQSLELFPQRPFDSQVFESKGDASISNSGGVTRSGESRLSGGADGDASEVKESMMPVRGSHLPIGNSSMPLLAASLTGQSLHLHQSQLQQSMLLGASTLTAGAGQRAVDSLFRSALRETAQQSMLRDVLNGSQRPRGPPSMSRMVLDANLEASYFWLDQYRERTNASPMPPMVDDEALSGEASV